MIYPFVTRSLTAQIEKKIHLAVRHAAPVKYWTFRLSTLLERIGGILGVSCLFVYFVAYSVAHSTGQLGAQQFDLLTEVLAKGVVAGLTLSISGGIFATVMFRELVPLTQLAFRDQCDVTKKGSS